MTDAPPRQGWPIARFLAMLTLWIALMGPGIADLAVGIPAAFLATLASRSLFPSAGARFSVPAIAAFAIYFLRASAVAGFDVARRAFDPTLPLQPGRIDYRPRLLGPASRRLFAMLSGMVPGTLVSGMHQDGTFEVHCLDLGQPVADQMRADEARVAAAVGAAPASGRADHG